MLGAFFLREILDVLLNNRLVFLLNSKINADQGGTVSTKVLRVEQRVLQMVLGRRRFRKRCVNQVVTVCKIEQLLFSNKLIFPQTHARYFFDYTGLSHCIHNIPGF